MTGILDSILRQDPARIAVRAGRSTVTYARLADDIDTMAQALLAGRIEPGERVALVIRDAGVTDYWDWILHLGAIRAGLVFSTRCLPPEFDANPAFGPLAAIIGPTNRMPADAKPRVRLVYAPRSASPLAEQLEIGTATQDLAGLEARTVRLNATSGTTGKPKVIAWDRDMFAARLDQVRALGDIAPDTVLFPLLGLITTTGLRYPLVAWQLGATVLLQTMAGEPSDRQEFAARSTFFATSPFRMERFLANVPGTWPDRDKRMIELFGGRVAPRLLAAVRSRCADDVRLSYGATEAGRVAAGDASHIARHPGAAGIVEPGAEVEIVDEAGNALPPGTEGMVRLRTAYLGDGYFGETPADAASSPFRDGWFYPGDTGVLYEDGLLAITGRATETINIAGAKLAPAEIEDKVRAIPGIADACALAMRVPRGDRLAIAVVCGSDGELETLRPQIAACTPKTIPFLLIRVPEIPRNAMGRIARESFAADIAKQMKPLPDRPVT